LIGHPLHVECRRIRASAIALATGYLLNGLIFLLGVREWADAILLISLTISLILAFSEWRTAPLLFLSGCLTGFFMELVGTRYGIPFGRYRYLSFERVSLWGVPIPIALAWGIYLYTAYLASLPIVKRFRRVMFTSLLMVILDTAVDPVMVERGIWAWDSSGPWFGIPTLNFLGWFLTSALAITIFELLSSSHPKGRSRLLYVPYLTSFFPIASISGPKSILAVAISFSLAVILLVGMSKLTQRVLSRS